jgi:hypothetical protein
MGSYAGAIRAAEVRYWEGEKDGRLVVSRHLLTP